MKKDNDKFAYYLPIGISLGVIFGICFDNIGIGICLGGGVAGILSLFSPFPRAFVARTQIYNQTQIHQNSSVHLDIIV